MALRGAASRCFLAAVRGRAASASRVRAAPAPLPSAPPRRVPPAAFSPFAAAAAAARPMAAAAMMGSPAAVAARLTGHPSASVRACCELSQEHPSPSVQRCKLDHHQLFLWSVISRWWRWPLSPSTIGGVRRPFLPPCSAPAEFSALPNPWLPTKCGDAFSQPDGSKMSTSKEEETPLYLKSRQSPSSMPLPSTNSFQPG
uniref:Uncharacterized protein n=1 Tax=Oryza glumipatula TaxID=40148 RepID=A0A0D9ZAN9_9ORYZ